MYQVVMPLWRYLVYSRGLFPAYLGSIWAKSDFEGLVLLIFNCQGAKVETIYHIYKTLMLCLQENESSQNNQAGTSIEISMVASILLFLNNCSFRSINLTKDIEALAVITSETVRGCGGLASLSLGEAFMNGSWSGTRCRMGRLAKNGESTVSTSYLEDCLLVLLDCELDWSWMDACNSAYLSRPHHLGSSTVNLTPFAVSLWFSGVVPNMLADVWAHVAPDVTAVSQNPDLSLSIAW